MKLDNEDKRVLFVASCLMASFWLGIATFSLITWQVAPIAAITFVYAVLGGVFALEYALNRLAKRWWQ